VGEGALAACITLLVISIVLYDYRDAGRPVAAAWIGVLVLLTGATAGSFWAASTVVDTGQSTPGDVDRIRQVTTRNRVVITVLGVLVAIAGGIFFWQGWYAWQLVLAVAIILALVGSAALGPSLAVADRRRRARRRLSEAAPDGATGAPAGAADATAAAVAPETVVPETVAPEADAPDVAEAGP
jgi:hypothetical protein